MIRQLSMVVFGLLFCAVALARPLPAVKPEREGFSADRLARITEITQSYVDEGKLAGVITMVARRGRIVHFEAVGNKGMDDTRPRAIPGPRPCVARSPARARARRPRSRTRAEAPSRRGGCAYSRARWRA